MKPVPFHHRKHEATYSNPDGTGIPCSECHHVYEDGKNIWTEEDNVMNCGAPGCHDPLETKGEKQYRLRLAYHENCKKCHRAVSEAGISENAPYVKCSSCHQD